MHTAPERAGVSKSQIEDIKERINIEDVVKRYVKLKPVGKNHFGLCPFHTEKSPSFSVNPELNIFKCYGCGEGGDVISFLQKIESLEFYETLEMLAKEAGITLQARKGSSASSQVYVRAKKAHEIAAKYFQHLLNKHERGKAALKYLHDRGITDAAIDEFTIGYSPYYSEKLSLAVFLRKQDFTQKELVSFGLLIQKGKDAIDKFPDRIMFPISDPTGTVIAFSGRTYKQDDNRPKYLNSPETIIFQKRNNLYGIHHAKQEIKKSDFAILTEGQIDVVSSWIVEVKNVVAPLGTGVTQQQLNKIKRYTSNLAVAFDNDSAGERAHKRTAALAYRLGFNVFSIEILHGNDADECIQHDPELWKKAVKNRTPSVTFFLNILSSQYDIKTLDGKQKILDEITPIIKSISDTVALDHYLKEIQLLLDIPLDILKDRLKQQTLSPLPSKTEDVSDFAPQTTSHESYLLALLLQFPETLSWANEKIPIDDIQSPDIKKTLTLLISLYKDKNNIEPKEFIDSLPEKLREMNRELLMQPLWVTEPTQEELTEEVTLSIRNIKEHAIREEISKLKKMLTLAEQRGDSRNANDILNSINSKLKELEALQK